MFNEIREQIASMGIGNGDKLMVHCAFSRIKANITPEGFCRLLMEIIGPQGLLMMPSFTYCNVEALRGEGHFYFDVQNTPGKTGVLAETFRKMPDVHRSWNPSHSFLAWGKDAESYVKNHHKGPTMGPGSPLEMLERGGGKVLLIACPHANTFFHVVETACGAPCLAQPPEKYDAILPSGERTILETFAWRNADCPVTDGKVYLRGMDARGLIRHGLIGNARSMCMEMKQCRKVLTSLLKGPGGCNNCPVGKQIHEKLSS